MFEKKVRNIFSNPSVRLSKAGRPIPENLFKELNMKFARSAGRNIGILLLLQLAAGLTIPFILLRPLATGAPAFLTTAAENAVQIRAAVLIAFAGAALTLALGITFFPVLRRCSEKAALWFFALCAVSCVLDAVHAATVMSMLSFSQQFVGAGGADPGSYQIASLAVAGARRWMHYSQLVAIGAWIFIFNASLLRFALIPRPLAALGLIGITLQFTGVTLSGFVGYRMIGEMAMPMLPIQIILALWLIVRGFNEPLRTADGELGFA
jgi:hypothetical protein